MRGETDTALAVSFLLTNAFFCMGCIFGFTSRQANVILNNIATYCICCSEHLPYRTKRQLYI